MKEDLGMEVDKMGPQHLCHQIKKYSKNIIKNSLHVIQSSVASTLICLEYIGMESAVSCYKGITCTVMCLSIGTPKSNKFSICAK